MARIEGAFQVDGRQIRIDERLRAWEVTRKDGVLTIAGKTLDGGDIRVCLILDVIRSDSGLETSRLSSS